MQSPVFPAGAILSGKLWAMDIPYWIEQRIKKIGPDFTGEIVLKCFTGGVTRVLVTENCEPPKTRIGAIDKVKIGGTD